MKLRLYPVLKDLKERENDIAKMAIESFEGFEYCYKLNDYEFALYKENGKDDSYLFPSLRPLDGKYAIGSGKHSIFLLKTLKRIQYNWNNCYKQKFTTHWFLFLCTFSSCVKKIP